MVDGFIEELIGYLPSNLEQYDSLSLMGFVTICAVTLLVVVSAASSSPPKITVGLPVSEEVGAPYRHPNHMKKLATVPPGNATSLFDLFSKTADKFPNRKCLGTRELILREEMYNETFKKNVEKLTLGAYKWQTYSEVKQSALDFGAGLQGLGQEAGKNISIFMETKAEWTIAALGCYAYSFPVVTVYATLGTEALEYGMNETEITHVITDSSLLITMKHVINDVPAVKCIIYCGEATEEQLEGFPGHVTVIPFKEVEAQGKKSKCKPQKTSQKDDLAVIMYTSGSTGMPKGVMMSHGNLLGMMAGVFSSIPELKETDRYIGYLPLAHALELVAELTMFCVGASVGYGSPTTLANLSPRIKVGTKGDVSELKPTLMACVPAIMDRIRKGVFAKLEKSPLMVQKMFHFAYEDKLKKVKNGIDHTPFWDRFVFKKIRDMLGGEVRLMLSGGAPLAPDTHWFMNVVFSCPVGQGYGLTETCGGSTVMDIRMKKVGNVGGPIACCEVKLVDWKEGGYLNADKDDPKIGVPRGEICISGANITLGYWKNETKTAESFITESDGKRWFYSGDIGQWNEDGSLSIIDRKKDLVKLQHGEYISLGKVEATMKVSRYVENCLIYADPFKSNIVAIVLPNEPAIKNLADELEIQGDYVSICNNETVVKEVLKDMKVTGVKLKLNRSEQPTKIFITTDHWTPENELVTAALKLKRENLNNHYKEQINKLYS